MKKLIIAEKPSVARNIADAVGVKKRNDGYMEGDQYIITWVFGHLLQLYDAVDYDDKMSSWKMENFPFVPNEFKYKVKNENGNRKKIDAGAQKQIGIIKQLMEREDVGSVVSATDWDREGQVIADEIFIYLETEKDVERLLLNEWTKDEVLKGLDELKSNKEMIPLQDAGFGRQIADWLIGINLTSVATVKYNNAGNNKLLNVGRVLLPTLKIIYDRDKEIEEFVSTKYYKLNLGIQTAKKETFEGVYYEESEISAEDDKEKAGEKHLSEKFESKEKLEEILARIDKKDVVIVEKEVEQKKENAPLLFNLSNLQGFVTSKHKGWTSDKVLKVAQELYEKKLITYPRTASSVLDESLKDKTKKVLEVVKKGTPFEDQIKFKDTKRIFDSKKVESHSAIMPTYVVPKNLTADEEKVYEAIKNRFLAQFLPQAISEETKLTMKVLEDGKMAEDLGVIIAKGKVQVQEGFRLAEKIQSKDTLLPLVEKGETLSVEDGAVKEIVKKPPKHHTEKTLLKVMETCGKSANEEDSEEMMMAILSGFSIGTPATRAETIKKLKDVGYITMDKKSLKCTELGKMMVDTFPVKELFDLDYTGRLEKTLADIERGKFSKQDFIDLIVEFTKKSVDDIKRDKVFAGKVSVDAEANIVGVCPNCGNPVVETEKAFGCSNWRNGCDFTVWKDDKFIEAVGKKVTSQMVEILLKNGKVGFHGLLSKKGNKFSAYLRYEKNETGNYRWEMEFIDRMR